MKRRTITFPDDVFNEIEKYRKKFTPIPSFTKAVIDLVKRGLRSKIDR